MFEKSPEEMTDKELTIVLNEMTMALHNKIYFDYMDGNIGDRDDLISNYIFLKKRYDILMSDKEEKEEVVIEKGDEEESFMKLWMELWKKKIKNQDDVGELYCLSVASQIFRDVKIMRGVEDDIRIHPCVIMPTGSGKSEGNTFIADFCQRCPHIGLTAAIPEEYSPATMIGTMNNSIIQSNIMAKARDEDDPDWRDPERKGLLGTTNFIIFDEGENILKTSSRTEGMQRILQHAMNRYGSATNTVTNDVVNGTVVCNPNCNIFISSYYLEEFKTTLLDRGLLQRMVILFKTNNDIDRCAIEEHILGGIEELDEGEDISDAFNRISSKRQELDKIYTELEKEATRLVVRHQSTEYIVLKKGVANKIKENKDLIREIVPNMTMYQEDIWEAMVSRLTPTFIKISAIYALMDYREYITAQDVEKASRILMRSMQSIAGFMMSKISSNQQSDASTNVYSKLASAHKGRRHTESEWIDIFITKFGMSPSRAKKVIKDFIITGKMHKVKTPEGMPDKKLIQLR